MPSLFLTLMLVGPAVPVEAPGTGPSGIEVIEVIEAEDADPGGIADVATVRRPLVHLVVDQVLAEWLLVRLLEDGYPLTLDPAAAQVQLTVTSSAQGSWRVSAVGVSAVAYDVEAAEDLAVIRLELLHRSIDALEDVVPGVSVAQRVPAVSLWVPDFSSPALAATVAAGILAAGATLVPMGTPAQLRVCADEAGGPPHVAHISVIDGERECDTEVELGSTEHSRAVLDSTTQLVTTAMGTLMDVDSDAQPVAEAEPERFAPTAQDAERAPGLRAAPRRFRTRRSKAPFVVRGGFAAGAIGRLSSVDAVFAGSLSFGTEPGVQGWLEVQTRPATVVGPFIVVEVVPAFGLKVRPWTKGRVSLELGGLLGAEIHNYQLRRGQVRTRGTDVAVSGESALGVAVALWGRHEVQVALRVGGSSARTHRIEGQEIWKRGGIRVGGMVGFSFGRRLAG